MRKMHFLIAKDKNGFKMQNALLFWLAGASERMNKQ